MTNDERRTVYLRDRAELTPAQRRRVVKHDHRSLDETRVNRAARMRRAMERRDARRLRREARQIIAAVRAGAFRRGRRRAA